MSFVLRSLPTKSTQLKNKNAASLIKFFESDVAALYLYGPTGSGKSFGVELLAKEFGYELIYLTPPFTELMITGASSDSLFLSDKKLVIVDIGDSLKSKEIRMLADGFWGESRLIIIGDTYPKSSPIRTAFKEVPYRFTAIKFHAFDKIDVLSCLTMYAGELGARVSYDTLNLIADMADGDMRAARTTLKNLIAAGDEAAIKQFLPMSESLYFNTISKLFSKDLEDVEEAVNMFQDYLTIQIIRKNLLKYAPKNKALMNILRSCATLESDFEGQLAQLGQIAGNVMNKKRFVPYRKAKQIEVPKIETNCSAVKKILYMRGFEKCRK
jgi:DNA polymerase III delta prime subunit